ncbi:MAG: hypothetical protein IIY91_06855, partial [Selenomonas sp.]|nr:hypothetical protein [Selenomonas sp.]
MELTGIDCSAQVKNSRLHGRYLPIPCQHLAGYQKVPALQAAVFDLGGTVNTCELHAQVIVDKSKIDSQAMAAMLAVFREAMTAQDGAALARAATQSAFLNQDNLYKQELTALWQLGK